MTSIITLSTRPYRLRRLVTFALLFSLLATLSPSLAASSTAPGLRKARYSAAPASPQASPTPIPSPYTISPSSGVQGREYEVIVISSACLQDTAKTPPKTPPTNPLKDFVLYAPDGSGIRGTTSSTSDCRITAKLSIASDAPLGDVKLWLQDKDKQVKDTVNFTVTGITAGPIPPGLNNKGQVDVMWSVLPDNVVHDNFGKKISKEYFCIDALIGNDSGFDLQVSNVGFTVPELNSSTSEGGAYFVPSIGYRMARGTLERAQQVGVRNRLLAFITSMGPLLTGFTPFFHAVNHRANFSEGVNIFSNPFEKGYEQVYPDTTIRQLDRLADQIWRDDTGAKTVIPNNTQLRLMTFFPKKFLFPPAARTKGSDYQRYLNKSDVDKVTFEYFQRNNPQFVMQKLGQIVLIGDVIQHTNRIRVISNQLLPNITDAPISGRITDDCNLGVANVKVTLSSDSGFAQRTETTDSAGDYTFANVPKDRRYDIKAKLDNATVTIRGGDENFVLRDPRTVNFRAVLNSFPITGKITKDSDTGQMSDISVQLKTASGAAIGEAVKPSNDGTYKFDVKNVAIKDSIRIVPTSTKFTFDPAERQQTGCTRGDVNFKATPNTTPTPKPTPVP
ncbi:MAG: carboxypeptidase-like regulatory domain-containing protein [Acidobacteria bacterium]|nr:carboxypeptidase-like regulatory domain-containing protein [Acidobacteriota bacterium]